MKIGTTHFDKIEYINLQNLKEIHICEKNSNFKFVISRQGLRMTGDMRSFISTEKELQEFAKMMSDIWAARRALDVKIAGPNDKVDYIL